MPNKTIKFYFAYNSPFSFLANMHVAHDLTPHDAQLVYKPVYSPRTGGGSPDLNSPKIKYMFEDFQRQLMASGMRAEPGPFADSKKACMGFLFAQEQGKDTTYHNAVFRARWLEEKDIGDAETLAGIAERAGLDRQTFLAALQDTRYEQALTQSNTDAEADEVFGFPFFIYNGQKFWGNDRVDWLVRALQRG
jgi:2-hydroxychromene-2-carboxylate isomerase